MSTSGKGKWRLVFRTILGLILSVAIIAGGWLGYICNKYSVLLSPTKIEARARELLPGAAPPDGLNGVIALSPEPDIQVAAFAPSLKKMKPDNLEGSDLRIIIAKPKDTGKKPDISEIIAKIQGAKAKKQGEMETLESEPTPLLVGGKPYVGMKSRVKLKSNSKKLQERLILMAPNSEVVIVLVLGTDESFNQKALDQFLAGLSAPLPIPGLPSLSKPVGLPNLPGGVPRPPKLPKPPGGPPGAPPF